MSRINIVLSSYKCPSWNVLYSSKHWAVRKEMADYTHSIVAYEIRNLNIKPFKHRVDILITAHLKRTIDADNVCSKLIIDGLKWGGVIQDDDNKCVRRVTTEVVKDTQEYTEIIIEELKR